VNTPSVHRLAPPAREPATILLRWVLITLCVLSGCQVVDGDGGNGARGEPPAVAPAVRLGSVALTADCEASDGGQVRSLRLDGSYNCDEIFTVAMTNDGQDVGPLQMELILGDVDSPAPGPTVGPTILCEDAGEPPSDGFRLDSVQTDGGSCQLGEARAFCEIEPLSAGDGVTVTLEICPKPEIATVTTEVVLGRSS
jgi:hypothetical protein